MNKHYFRKKNYVKCLIKSIISDKPGENLFLPGLIDITNFLLVSSGIQKPTFFVKSRNTRVMDSTSVLDSWLSFYFWYFLTFLWIIYKAAEKLLHEHSLILPKLTRAGLSRSGIFWENHHPSASSNRESKALRPLSTT